MNRKKFPIGIVLLLVFTLILSACAPAAAPAEAPAADEAAAEEATAEPEEEAAEEEASSEDMGDAVELRMTWYDDGNEGEVIRDLLDRFEADNPNIKVVIDTVPYSSILDTLPIQLAAGEGPDMARVTDLGGLAQYYLDMTPYLSDPAYWEENFGSTLPWLRVTGDESAINGFSTQLTIDRSVYQPHPLRAGGNPCTQR